MVDQQELETLLGTGHETRSFEVKGPGNLGDTGFVAKVSRASMAMGNHRDGGLVCIGIDDNNLKQMAPGLSDSQFREWSDYDNVSAALARFSDPPVTFTLHPMTLSSGVKVALLEIAEFEHVPHICKRNYPQVLQDGFLYVRSRRQPESVPVPSYAEMRELIDLATNKALREFVARANAAGLPLGGAPTLTQHDRDAAAFDAEAEEGWDS